MDNECIFQRFAVEVGVTKGLFGSFKISIPLHKQLRNWRRLINLGTKGMRENIE
jgi:hypothetical protein